MLDYARTFQLPTLVFRMSCIYGPHQLGNEDQGWVAHFLIRALEDREITVYGDGRQVRDILFVEDLVDAFLLARQRIGNLSGQAFNMGGGPANTISLLELVDLMAELQGARPKVRFESWRPADQQYYVSDTRRFSAATNWTPRVNVQAGIQALHAWLREYRTSPPLPVIVPAPRTLAVRKTGGRSVSKLQPVQLGVLRRRSRAKRIWKLDRGEPAMLGRKIIRFP